MAHGRNDVRNTIGLILFWLGAAMIFVGSWLVMWWIAPFWRSTPPEELSGTIWAFGGLVFMLIALSVPLGLILLTIGVLTFASDERPRTWPFIIVVLIAVLAAVSMLVLPQLPYYPLLFGVAGGLILLFFFAAVWFWARRRRRLSGGARLAADYLLLSWVFVLLTATTACSMLGNPYGGLFFAERVLAESAMPWYYSMGTKLAIYVLLAMLFAFLSQWVGVMADREAAEGLVEHGRSV
jgi:hypothetical protein